MRTAILLTVVLLHACGEPEVVPTPPADQAPPPTPAQAPACTTDLECQTCGLRTGCRCALAPNPECGPSEHPCVAEPCHSSSASCWEGHCYLRPAAAAPCTSDAECEVRADDCRCDLYAALASSPHADPCSNRGRGCGGRPAPNQYRARCDTTANRCVLERRP